MGIAMKWAPMLVLVATVSMAQPLRVYSVAVGQPAVAKIERGHSQDLDDVTQMLARGLVGRQELRARFDEIEPQLHRYPAIDPASFRRAVERATG